MALARKESWANLFTVATCLFLSRVVEQSSSRAGDIDAFPMPTATAQKQSFLCVEQSVLVSTLLSSHPSSLPPHTTTASSFSFISENSHGPRQYPMQASEHFLNTDTPSYSRIMVHRSGTVALLLPSTLSNSPSSHIPKITGKEGRCIHTARHRSIFNAESTFPLAFPSLPDSLSLSLLTSPSYVESEISSAVSSCNMYHCNVAGKLLR